MPTAMERRHRLGYSWAMLKVAPFVLALLATPALAQPAAPAAGYPKKIPAPGGEVIIPSAGAQRAYDEINYAPARRAGDFLYISGVIAGPAPDETRDPEGFKLQVRRAFNQIQRSLQAAGASFADVVMINSFHVWDSPNFTGTRDQQVEVIAAVKDEFSPGPHPAWTAVGTTGLLSPSGVVEIQMIAYVPQKR